jgi:predicted small lipoprotein YifL
MRTVLVLCLAVAALAACGVKDAPAFPQGAVEGLDADAFENDNDEQGLLE